jgi:PAS domain S-box-containing protein
VVPRRRRRADGAIRRLAVVHPDPAKQALARELERGYPPAVEDALGAPVVLRTREAELVPEVTDAMLTAVARDARHLEILGALGMGSFMVVPMVARGAVVGCMTFVSAEAARRYDADDLTLAEDLAARCALAVDNARLYRDAGRARAAALAARGDAEHERVRLRAVVLHTPAPLALVEGPEHRFTLVNEAYKRVSGGGRDVTGLTPRAAFPELTGSGIHELFDQVYATGEPWEGPETPVRYDRDGTGVQDTWFNLRLEPVRDAQGEVIGVFNFAVDVTDQVLARREVERHLADAEAARREAEAANRAKSEFLAVMSHELRTPLNAIGGYVELIEMGIRGPVTAQQREDLGRIQRSQRHLLGLVNEVLNYARLETGAVQYELRDVRVCDAVTEAEGLILPQARARKLALSVADCPDALAVRADPEKLRQVLVNLLSNADQVHERTRRPARARRGDLRARARRPRPRQRARHRDRHRRGQAGGDLRALRAGPGRPDAHRRRGGAGARHQPGPGARHGRRPDGREHAGRGKHVHARSAGRVTR